MLKHVKGAITAASLISLAFATAARADSAKPAEIDGYRIQTFGGWGMNPADIDKGVKPGDDFFAYVNGKWDRIETIPPQYSYSGVALALTLGAEQAVKDIVQGLAATPQAPGTDGQRIADSYRAFLDRPAIDAAGMAPAQPWLDRIKAAKTRADLAALFAAPGYPSPVGFSVQIDAEKPGDNAVYSDLGGLGLPDRDYYLVDNERNRELQGKYRDLVAFMLGKAGYADAAGMAAKVYEFEHKIAVLDWDKALQRNPLLTTNRISRADLVAMGGAFPVAALLDGSGLDKAQSVFVGEIPPSPDKVAKLGLTKDDLAKLGGGMPALIKLLGEEDIATLQAWTTAHFLMDHAAVLPSDIDDARFAFYGKTLQGRERDRQRWQRALSSVQGQMGEAIGKAYVEQHFPPSSKAAMVTLVSNLRAALGGKLKTLAWMSPATRKAALAKLDAFTVKIGYPDKFKSYAGMDIKPGQPLANAIEASRWAWQDMLDELGKPVDKTKWLMTPQTVNAYYQPTANEIVFPAAFLQPPYFNAGADPAVNYGAVGATIGHEIGHGFDDEGSRYDGTGALKDWWTKADRKTFDALGAKLAAQYDKVCPYDEGKTCHNGKLTLGENIGDLAGLSMAYSAYKLSLKGKPAAVIDGLTGDQRFFLSYAQSWREKIREQLARQLLKTDPHSLAVARVNAVVRNFDPWYAAFSVKPGDKLYLAPKDRVRIW
ncbi:peptidase M13 [Novosphingobium sediminis]|uniref:Peptidase M13 n=1 Tax=Novosphingobium sediminis TaxID=707214 RepID=A0A512AP34_9SPHN|nr:M13 family metallopeptidase [Novosphingobium sediminis]GEO01469.1 peptidase M13 [Novosphingobium sediminis]